jgi:hypothetical protein
MNYLVKKSLENLKVLLKKLSPENLHKKSLNFLAT